MKLHILKLKSEYLGVVFTGIKKFELRKNDRDYQVNDLIHFVYQDGNEIGEDENVFKITYILKDVPEYGLDKDYCILGIERMD